MGFTLTFNTDAASLGDLDAFLRGRSYVVGFSATQTDVELFNALGKAPDAAKFPNVARFYNHIASFSADARKAFPAAFGAKAGAAAAKGGKAAAPAAKAAAPAPAEEDDDAADLFGDDDDDAAAAKIAAKAAAAKKTEEPKKEKKASVDKSSVVYEVKPLEAGQDMKDIENKIRSIEVDGLLWGQEFKVVDVAFGIQKLIVQAILEDEKITTDDLEEKMNAWPETISSVDLVNVNKVAGR